jgi:hypothetical protein
MPRFMIIVKATPDSEAGRWPEGSDKLFEAMRIYHEDLAKAGALLDASGLHPSSKGWRVRYAADGRQSVIDGPFAESKELVAGYTLIQTRTREEALEWTRRFRWATASPPRSRCGNSTRWRTSRASHRRARSRSSATWG